MQVGADFPSSSLFRAPLVGCHVCGRLWPLHGLLRFQYGPLPVPSSTGEDLECS